MKLVTLDPGFHRESGHHWALNELIGQECQRRGVPVEYYVSCSAKAEVLTRFAAHALFRFNPYARVKSPSAPEFEIFHQFNLGNALTYEDLRSAGIGLSAGDVVLVHTITPLQLHGMAAWFIGLPQPRPALIVMFRFPPWYRIAPRENDLVNAMCAYTLRLLRALPDRRCVIAADSITLSRCLEGLTGEPVPILPIPLAPDSSSYPAAAIPGVPEHGSARDLHVVFAGEARGEKGFELLPQALARVLAMHPRVRFTIQATGLVPAQLASIRAAFARISANIEVIGEVLTQDRYRALIAASDAVLMPYDPGEYTYRTSHVFVDALAQGKPMVFTAGTWMDAEARAVEATIGNEALGARLAAFGADGLSQAIDDCVRNHARYAAAAGRAAPAYRARHNMRSYLDDVFALAAGAAR